MEHFRVHLDSSFSPDGSPKPFTLISTVTCGVKYPLSNAEPPSQFSLRLGPADAYISSSPPAEPAQLWGTQPNTREVHSNFI